MTDQPHPNARKAVLGMLSIGFIVVAFGVELFRLLGVHVQ